MTNHPGNALIAFSAQSNRPFHGGSFTDPAAPIGADFRQIVRPNIGGSAAIGAVNHYNGLIRKGSTRIGLRNCWIVPGRDFPKVDASNNIGCELKFPFKSWNIVSGNDSAQHGREVKHSCSPLLLEGRDLLVFHWPVAGSEVNRSSGYLRDSATAADGLVIDLNFRMLLMVLIEPLRIDGIRKRRSCAI